MKIIIGLVLVMVGISLVFYFTTRVGEIPELEYKYKKGETLYYAKKGKERAWSWGFLPRYWKRGAPVKGRYITTVTINDITENGEYAINIGDLADTEGTGRLIGVEVEGVPVYPIANPRYPIMNRKGDTPIRAENMFFGTQPRFEEGIARRSWEKTIYLPGYRKRVDIPVKYEIVRKVWGRKNTYRIKTSYVWVFVDDQGKEYITKLKGYSDFNAEEGRIIKMKSSRVTRMKGDVRYTHKIEASWRLMSDEEIFKLSGIEKEWELVVPDGGVGDIARDGRLALVKGESIYVSEADGSRPVKVAERGGRLKWSPDGKMIAYTKERVVGEKKHRAGTVEVFTTEDLFVINLEDREEELLYENIISGALNRWSPDSKWIGFYVGEKYFESEPMMVNVETKEVKKIERNNYPLWYIDIYFTDKSGKLLEKENIISWSPDVRYVAVRKYRPTRGLFIISKETQEEDILIKADPKKESFLPICWSSDGKFILFEHENRIGEVDKRSYKIYSLESRKIVTEVISERSEPSIGGFHWSYDGKYLYFRTESSIGMIKGTFRLKIPDEIAKKISKRVGK